MRVKIKLSSTKALLEIRGNSIAHSSCASVLVILDLINALSALSKDVIDIYLHFFGSLSAPSILSERCKLVSHQVLHTLAHLLVRETFYAHLHSFSVYA